MKYVLYLSAHTALWICFKRTTVVDYFEETMVIDPNEPYKKCGWLNTKQPFVHLLIDCEQTEIDAYPLLPSRSRWSDQSNKKALRNKLIDRFPNAIVRTAKNNTKLDAALVQQINLPQTTLDWLVYIENSSIVLCSTSTVAEVHADRWGKSSHADGSVVVSVTKPFVRHTYCRSGHALFTRSVGLSDSTEFGNQVSQTLDHLSTSGLVESAIPVYCIGLDELDITYLDRLEYISQLIAVDDDITIVKRKLVDLSTHSSKLLSAQWLVSSDAVRTNNSHRYVSYAINNYLRRAHRKKLVRQYMAVAVLFIVSIGFFLLNERERALHLEQYQARRDSLFKAIRSYQIESESLSAQSEPLSRALLDRIALNSVSGISPGLLLTMLAQAFTTYRELELVELQWVVVDSEHQSPNVGSDSADGMLITTRNALPNDGDAPSITKVVITGRVVQGGSLREQHDALAELTAYLEQQSNVYKLLVLVTPLTQIGSATQVENEFAERPEFQLQFEMHRSVGNEA